MKQPKLLLLLSSIVLLLIAGIGGGSTQIVKANVAEISTGEISANPTIDELLVFLRELDAKNQSLIRQKGWLHSVVERVNPNAEENLGTYLEGLTPKFSRHESWVYVEDDQGRLGLSSFTHISDEAGKIVQIAASDSSGKGGNLTLLQRGVSPDTEVDPKQMLLDPSFVQTQLSQYLLNLERDKEELQSIKAITEDGILTLTKVYGLPNFVDADEYDISFVGFHETTRIELSTGFILEGRTFSILPSGELELWSEYHNTLTEAGLSLPLSVEKEWKSVLAEIAEEKLKASTSEIILFAATRTKKKYWLLYCCSDIYKFPWS